MTRAGARVAVVVDVGAVSSVPVDELYEAVALRVRPELVEWSEVGDHTGHDDDGIPDTGDRAAARAVSLGVPTVLACGDDVTVRRCLEALAGATTALGIVSLGQGSLLAANIGLPPGLEALPHALEGEVRHIDVGEVDGELFGVHAGFGIEALAGRRRDGEPLTAAALLHGLRDLWRATSAVTVHVDGVQRFDGRTVSVVVANAPRGAGRSVVVPGAEPDDGLLDLVVVAPRWPHQRLRSLWRLVIGRPQDERDLVRVMGEWVAIQLWDRREVQLDGEPRRRTPRIDVRVWPGALAVRVPPPELVDLHGVQGLHDEVGEVGEEVEGVGVGEAGRTVLADADSLDAPPMSDTEGEPRAGVDGAVTN